MKYVCNTCKKETEGFMLTMKDKPHFVCLECKGYTDYVPKEKVSSPTFIMRGSGFHDTDYGKHGRK
jgi:predicted nucleic acid-binding Zn ribbon protein